MWTIKKLSILHLSFSIRVLFVSVLVKCHCICPALFPFLKLWCVLAVGVVAIVEALTKQIVGFCPLHFDFHAANIV